VLNIIEPSIPEISEMQDQKCKYGLMLYFTGIYYSEVFLKYSLSPNMAFPSDQFYKEMCVGTAECLHVAVH